jgi:hypothetical protein
MPTECNARGLRCQALSWGDLWKKAKIRRRATTKKAKVHNNYNYNYNNNNKKSNEDKDYNYIAFFVVVVVVVVVVTTTTTTTTKRANVKGKRTRANPARLLSKVNTQKSLPVEAAKQIQHQTQRQKPEKSARSCAGGRRG